MFFHDWTDLLLDPEGLYLLFLPVAIFLFLFLRSRLLFSRKRECAEITKIKPFFKSQTQAKTKLLLCDYLYVYGEKSYSSQCLLPIRCFFRKQRGSARLSYDTVKSLPILSYKKTCIVGEQAIQHYLLQFKKNIKISYEKARPEISYPHELAARPMPKKLRKLKAMGKKNLSQALFLPFVLLSFFAFSGKAFAQESPKQAPREIQNDLGIEKTEEKQTKEYKRALNFYLRRNFGASLEVIRSIFEEQKENMALRILAGANYIALGKPSRAAPHIQAAMRLHPQGFEPSLFYTRLLRSQKKYYKALVHARRAMQRVGEVPALRLEAAAVYYELKNYPKARIQLQRVMELDPQNYYAFYMDALIFLQERRYELAEFRLRNALALHPKHKRDLKLLYNNLAFALEKKGESLEKSAKIAQARQCYREAKAFYSYALSIEPQNEMIRSNKERIDRR